MSRGILYLALGEEFDKLTAATAHYSRRFTDLPMCVITNLDQRDPVWLGVKDVRFSRVTDPSNENRRIKVSLIDYTPFSETLFMDSDAVIQNEGIEVLFGYLEDYDIACQYFATITSSDDKNFETAFIEKTYDKLAKLLRESYPIEMFGEAALLFRRTGPARDFFRLWQEYWELMGCGRDMPAFSFAVKHSPDKVKVFKGDVPFCTNAENEDFFIQHKGFSGFEKKFGLPEYQDWNPKL